MSAPSKHSSVLDALAAELAPGGPTDLRLTIAAIDADRLAALANGPASWELARDLRHEVDARAKDLEAKRAALAIAQLGVAWAEAYRRTADPPDDYSIETHPSHEEQVLS